LWLAYSFRGLVHYLQDRECDCRQADMVAESSTSGSTGRLELLKPQAPSPPPPPPTHPQPPQWHISSLKTTPTSTRPHLLVLSNSTTLWWLWGHSYSNHDRNRTNPGLGWGIPWRLVVTTIPSPGPGESKTGRPEDCCCFCSCHCHWLQCLTTVPVGSGSRCCDCFSLSALPEPLWCHSGRSTTITAKLSRPPSRSPWTTWLHLFRSCWSHGSSPGLHSVTPSGSCSMSLLLPCLPMLPVQPTLLTLTFRNRQDGASWEKLSYWASDCHTREATQTCDSCKSCLPLQPETGHQSQKLFMQMKDSVYTKHGFVLSAPVTTVPLLGPPPTPP
jgi:hypothetical protein